ncbi:MAG: RDD family protein [Methanomassiliicoccales archaeon]|nr:RDD family protein [Methanomassiliicoccales archaeon]
MPTGYDLLQQSGDFRRHWLRRIVAGMIDATIVAVPISLALVNVSSATSVLLAGIFSGVGWFLYSAILEGWFGQTIGKKLLHLRVVSMGDKGRFHQAVVRSVPKVFWYAFLPFDIFAGLGMEGDPRQRWSDHVANTTVVCYQPSTVKFKRKKLQEAQTSDANPAHE